MEICLYRYKWKESCFLSWHARNSLWAFLFLGKVAGAGGTGGVGRAPLPTPWVMMASSVASISPCDVSIKQSNTEFV